MRTAAEPILLAETMNRPERMNARSADLSEAFVEAGAEADVRPYICRRPGVLWRKPFQPLLSRVQRYVFEVVYETIEPALAAFGGCRWSGTGSGLRLAAEHALLGLPEAKRGKGAHFANVMPPQMTPPGIALEMP